jgi:hypothetical protein
VFSAPSAAVADLNKIAERTFLTDIRVGSSRSNIAVALSNGGYELADGTPVDFRDWYSPRRDDLNVLFMTVITPNLGLQWGASLGERGVKYRINPGLWLGVVARHELGARSSLTFSAITLLGGDFREQTCVGDYGDIGGVQEVNCRWAASILPPEETLAFLVNEPGRVDERYSLRYEFRF